MSGFDARSRSRPAPLGALLWLGLLAMVTAGLLSVRDSLDIAHVALAYLLVVQGASARHGRPLGLGLAILAFLCFDAFFIPPYGTLAVAKRVDLVVLGVFLFTSIVTAQLFERSRREARTATERADEVDRLSTLGAETLNAGRADEALGAVLAVIRTALDFDVCAVYLDDEAQRALRLVCRVPDSVERARAGLDEIVAGVFRTGAPVAIHPSGIVDQLGPGRGNEVLPDTLPPGVTDLALPLGVRGRIVGVLTATRVGGIVLLPEQRRFLSVLAYYTALGTERMRLAARAEHVDALRERARVKDAVLASVSHDLRTPLTTITALAHELAQSGDERAQVIEDEAMRLGVFVGHMLDLSRLDSGAQSLTIEPNEAEDLIGAVLRLVSGASEGREIRIRLEGKEPLLFGRFDFSETLRAVVNLVENALKYSSPDSPIELGARRDGDWLAFSVADRGPGVPESERERIFEPFYRRPAGPPDIRGAGLGLSIARAAATAQGGTLSHEPREGGGSIFTLRVQSVDVERLSAE